MKKICSIEGCGKTVFGHGWCNMHYARMRKYGHMERVARKQGAGWIAHGYRLHSRASKVCPEHVMVAEKALGRPLPKGAVVHHVNEIRADNRGCNLVICPNQAYHALLHRRMRAYDACGHADWRKCRFCKQYDAPEKLYISPQGSIQHNPCAREYERRLALMNGPRIRHAR
jgi:hypothetical protein